MSNEASVAVAEPHGRTCARRGPDLRRPPSRGRLPRLALGPARDRARRTQRRARHFRAHRRALRGFLRARIVARVRKPSARRLHFRNRRSESPAGDGRGIFRGDSVAARDRGSPAGGARLCCAPDHPPSRPLRGARAREHGSRAAGGRSSAGRVLSRGGCTRLRGRHRSTVGSRAHERSVPRAAATGTAAAARTRRFWRSLSPRREHARKRGRRRNRTAPRIDCAWRARLRTEQPRGCRARSRRARARARLASARGPAVRAS